MTSSSDDVIYVEGRKNHDVEERGHEKHNRTSVKSI
jgi:hypothetical protein